MRIPVAATVLLLVALLGFGWHNQLRLVDLRKTQRQLTARAAARGIDPNSAVPATRRPRPDPVTEAKTLAAEFIAYAKEMEALGRLGIHSADLATRQRMMEQMDGIMSLNGTQLKILIDEILADGEAEDTMRRHLLRFLIPRLSRDYPQDTLALLTGSSELREILDLNSPSTSASLIATAVGSWAANDPSKALAWFRENSASLSETSLKRIKSSLLNGLAANDLRLALALHDEFGNPPHGVEYLITRGDQSPQARIAALAVIREWSATLEDEKVGQRVLNDCLAKLALGSDSASAAFLPTTQWIASAKLSPKEFEFITRVDLLDLTYYIKPEETGQWLEWLGRSYPPDVSSRRISQLITNRRTKTAAKEWLATAPDSPAKRNVIRAYAR